MLQVKLNVISIQDYDRAIDFYTNKLGFEVVTDARFGENQRWVELAIPNCPVKLVLFRNSEENQPTPCSNIIFSCDDLEQKYRELTGKGVEFSQAPKQESWGMSSLFKDSEGNTFCLSSESRQ